MRYWETKVATQITPGHQWNLSRFSQLFTPQSARNIQTMELPCNSSTHDLSYWLSTTSDEYTAPRHDMLIFFMQKQQEISSMTTLSCIKFFRTIWSQNIMPKWQLFLWKLWNNNLATKINLLRRQIGQDDSCLTCGLASEDLQDIFKFCLLASGAWMTSNMSINSRDNRHIPLIGSQIG